MKYFAELLRLLEMEREEDRKGYRQYIETSSVNSRRENGLTWYPVAIRDTELGRGEYLTLEVERTTHQDIPHQLRFGASAVLFSNHHPKENRLEGIISFLGGNRLKLVLRTDELPDWTRKGKLGIDLLFDENSYDEMVSALKQAQILSEKPGKDQLIHTLTEGGEIRFDDKVSPLPALNLNPVQQSAVEKILAARELAIVHGPPGTGKTTTLVQAVKALIRRDHQQVLVAAPSNTAVDLLTERLSDEGLNVIRIGNPVRVSDHLTSLTLDGRMADHPEMKSVKKMKKQANEFRIMAHKYKRNFGRAEREQRRALFDEAHRILKEVEQTERYIMDNLLSHAQVITATLIGANHFTVRHLTYSTVFIDEAGQALEPACWIPVLKAQKVVLAGDHNQLPPTIKSQDAARQGLEVTLLEKCTKLYPESVVMLEEQYRMHGKIMEFSSRQFYQHKLKAHSSVADHLLFEGDLPLVFVDTAGCGFDEQTDGANISNPEEAAFLFRHLTSMMPELAAHYTLDHFPSIGIISPYRQQINLLQEQLLHSPALQLYRERININTIDSFQGQERDIIYISLTRSNSDSRIGFLSEIRRMNVAMTRARKKLIVIGDSATLSQTTFYADFISYAEQIGAYKSAWEW